MKKKFSDLSMTRLKKKAEKYSKAAGDVTKAPGGAVTPEQRKARNQMKKIGNTLMQRGAGAPKAGMTPKEMGAKLANKLMKGKLGERTDKPTGGYSEKKKVTTQGKTQLPPIKEQKLAPPPEKDRKDSKPNRGR